MRTGYIRDTDYWLSRDSGGWNHIKSQDNKTSVHVRSNEPVLSLEPVSCIQVNSYVRDMIGRGTRIGKVADPSMDDTRRFKEPFISTVGHSQPKVTTRMVDAVGMVDIDTDIDRQKYEKDFSMSRLC